MKLTVLCIFVCLFFSSFSCQRIENNIDGSDRGEYYYYEVAQESFVEMFNVFVSYTNMIVVVYDFIQIDFVDNPQDIDIIEVVEIEETTFDIYPESYGDCADYVLNKDKYILCLENLNEYLEEYNYLLAWKNTQLYMITLFTFISFILAIFGLILKSFVKKRDNSENSLEEGYYKVVE
eukprot:TRINITY_DN4579_c1_g2_i1.p1 TRINITY_DN4579_c1_g2~~TRINITY_DN4579_c1_g2_i1.p1  ORF type:complete len:178 (+),score=39.83 TRINITY_DN4579_c1_g2_i1:83-616(+)